MQPPEPPVDSEQTAANILNGVMVAFVGLSVTVFGLWIVLSGIGPMVRLYNSLADQMKQHLGTFLAGLFLITPGGVRLFWSGMQRIRQSVPGLAGRRGRSEAGA